MRKGRILYLHLGSIDLMLGSFVKNFVGCHPSKAIGPGTTKVGFGSWAVKLSVSIYSPNYVG